MSCLGCRSEPKPVIKKSEEPTPTGLTFEDYVRLANSFMVTLRRPEDREYLEDILQDVQRLHASGKAEVRRHNTIFMAYLIKLLHIHCATQPLEVYNQWYKQGAGAPILKGPRTRVWLEENKSYFLMEKTVDGGIIFYAAIAVDPRDGWDKGGLARL